MDKTSYSREELAQKTVPELLRLLTDEKRLQKARAIKYTEIRIIFQSDAGYMYEIKGSKESYFLRIDRKNRAIVHNCEDFLRRGIRDGILCKHCVRVLQEIYKKDAKEILIELLLNLWTYVDSDEYLKK